MPGDDSGQKTMGIDFGIPLDAICDIWIAHDGPERHVMELNFFFPLYFLLPGIFHMSCCSRMLSEDTPLFFSSFLGDRAFCHHVYDGFNNHIKACYCYSNHVHRAWLRNETCYIGHASPQSHARHMIQHIPAYWLAYGVYTYNNHSFKRAGINQMRFFRTTW